MLLIAACAPAASTTDAHHEIAQSPALGASTLADLAVVFARLDGKALRKVTYLRPLQRLSHQCDAGSVVEIEHDVERLAEGLSSARLVPAPRAAAAAALAAEVRSGLNCADLSTAIVREVDLPLPRTKSGWGGYAGTAAAWRLVHRGDGRAISTSGPGRVFTLVERFATPLTAQLALASIEHSLLPGSVHVVYALKASQCQQAIFMGPTLGKLFGNAGLGAFVELSSGNGVGRTRYDPSRVDRARITPLGRIGGQPCT